LVDSVARVSGKKIKAVVDGRRPGDPAVLVSRVT